MEKRIIRRTYTIDDGKPSNKVVYIWKPLDMSGQEIETSTPADAYIFGDNDMYMYSEEIVTCSGKRRSGKYSYKQEVLKVNIEIIEPV